MSSHIEESYVEEDITVNAHISYLPSELDHALLTLPSGFKEAAKDIIPCVATDEVVFARWKRMAVGVRPFFKNREEMMTGPARLGLSNIILLGLSEKFNIEYNFDKSSVPSKKKGRTREQEVACFLKKKYMNYSSAEST